MLSLCTGGKALNQRYLPHSACHKVKVSREICCLESNSYTSPMQCCVKLISVFISVYNHWDKNFSVNKREKMQLKFLSLSLFVA